MMWPLNIPEFLTLLEKQLKDFYHGDEAKAILRYFWDYSFDKPWSSARREEENFTDEQYEIAKSGARRLLQGEPVQYVVGRAHFYGYDYWVDNSVLIPRPETEGLVLWMKEEWLKISRVQGPKLLDIGTGSGCIPITLALELKKEGLRPSKLFGIDISEAALDMARKNAESRTLEGSWVPMDIFQASEHDFSDLDVVVSNPPYVPQSEEMEMDMNVRDYEPEKALFVPDEDKLLYYKKISELALHWLKPGGLLFYEIHYSQGEPMTTMLEEMGYKGVSLRKDLAGKDRMVKGVR